MSVRNLRGILPRPRRACLAALVSLIAVAHAQAQLPPLIPRDALFPKPAAMQSVRLSPDGRLLSYLAPDAGGVAQLWVRDLEAGTSRPLTRRNPDGVVSYLWAANGRIVCYEYREERGSRLVALDVATGVERPLIALDGARFGNPVVRDSIHDELLISMRLQDAPEDDVYRVNVVTGTLVLDTKNPGGVSGDQFFADAGLRVRAALRNTADSGTEVLVRDAPSDPWRSWLTAHANDSLEVQAFTSDGKALLLRTDLGADKARLVARGILDGREQVIAADRDLDVENVLLHPRTGAVQAVSFLGDPRRWQALDKAVGRDLAAIDGLAPGPQHVGIPSRDRTDSRWLACVSDDRTPRRCYLWNRATREGTLLFDEQPEIVRLPLARVKPMSFKARDGLRIPGYLTLPVGVPARKLPLVVWVHGGPYLRDAWGYDHIGQLFANRGYAFLRLNYRGSRGFGRAFRLAGFKQWGRAMQDDVTDAVQSLVGSGVVDRNRMAIAGHSYGGYSVLAALTLTPDLFACGAARSTFANIVTFINAFPRTPDNGWVRATIGDPEDPNDLKMLTAVSPLARIDRLSKPLLIAIGDRDDAIPRGDLDTFLTEAGKRGHNVTAVVYEGDGHFFRRENDLDFFARAEALFAQVLGGRAEPPVESGQPGATPRVRIVGR